MNSFLETPGEVFTGCSTYGPSLKNWFLKLTNLKDIIVVGGMGIGMTGHWGPAARTEACAAIRVREAMILIRGSDPLSSLLQKKWTGPCLSLLLKPISYDAHYLMLNSTPEKALRF
jgi:hypothetical protein